MGQNFVGEVFCVEIMFTRGQCVLSFVHLLNFRSITLPVCSSTCTCVFVSSARTLLMVPPYSHVFEVVGDDEREAEESKATKDALKLAESLVDQLRKKVTIKVP